MTEIYESAHGVMVDIERNGHGHGEMSSNPGWSCLHFR